jgi:hypothetical protein
MAEVVCNLENGLEECAGASCLKNLIVVTTLTQWNDLLQIQIVWHLVPATINNKGIVCFAYIMWEKLEVVPDTLK